MLNVFSAPELDSALVPILCAISLHNHVVASDKNMLISWLGSQQKMNLPPTRGFQNQLIFSIFNEAMQKFFTFILLQAFEEHSSGSKVMEDF